MAKITKNKEDNSYEIQLKLNWSELMMFTILLEDLMNDNKISRVKEKIKNSLSELNKFLNKLDNGN